jgi:peptidoglycan-associated lipoprotein
MVSLAVSCSGNKDKDDETSSKNSSSENQSWDIAPASMAKTLAEGVPAEVFFAFDSSELTSESKDSLKKQFAYLTTKSHPSITVEGHADERGTKEYNLALGLKRANAVKHYLVSLGYKGTKVKAVTFGKEKPAVEGSTDRAHALNRRSATVIVK